MAKMALAFRPLGSTVEFMDKPWYRRWFARIAHGGDLEATRAKAAQGDAEAQYSLGLKYGCGDQVVLDLSQAAAWYRRAADQDHPLAQFNLAMMYAEGQGVTQDDAEAVRWIRRAAALGDAGAQFNLAVRCQRASLSREQPAASEAKIEAYKWFQLAAAQGYGNSAQFCESMNLSMTLDEVAQGDRRAEAFTHALHPNAKATASPAG